ncbi:MAG: error-prone DNA polymerase [Luteolibacter sp.]|uniref:DNA polymerase III subunit alpha n=1 Tax=Luteolibacter sp. TaxID=1962973 RepID=UPI003266AB4E
MFCEFHARSAFSFLRGSSPPDEMVKRAAALGYSAIAITDHGGFCGSARAHEAAKESGIRAIVGATLDLPDGSHLPVLCTDQIAYQILSRHLTDLHLEGAGKARDLKNSGLIALTGDRDGPLIRPLLRDDKSAALAAAQSLITTFGSNNVYVEINRHRLRDDGRLNRYLVDLAAHLRLPLLASNAPLHATRADRMLADAFTCLRHHVTLDQAGGLLTPNGERHLRSPAEMMDLFADLPEAIRNTRVLSDRVGFTLENLGYSFPDFPDEHGKPMSKTGQTQMLRELAYVGARKFYGTDLPQKVGRQLDDEIRLIDKLGFPGYFLIVHDLVKYAKGEGMLCQGRGSAANSIVCFSLGITKVDPIGYKLVFERFLNEKSESWPDIDIDFPSGELREKVIQYVFGKYGARGAAMTANVITYRPRSAFREMSKVLGFPASLADRFSKESSGFRHFAEEGKKPEREAEFENRMASLLPPSHPRLPALFKLYDGVLGMPRHLGQHSGGIIICDNRLDAVVPIQPATMPKRTIVQWDKNDCEELGIVKIDLLGLGILAAMQESISICQTRGKDFDLATIPADDPKVYKMLHEADTIGTFQVESRAQMATLPILKPINFYDIAIEVAIIRPGPITGDLMHPYLNRRLKLETVEWIHDDCKDILKRTLGVPLFQEQMLSIAKVMADFTSAELDDLRRAISFNRSHIKMQRATTKLRERMTAKGIDEVVQERIIQATGNFALYGFPESHAISFAYLAYASCWLKVNHAAEFYTGLINNQPMGFYSVNTLLQDAKHHGLRILPVCCIHSAELTQVIDDRTIRLGLNRLKNLGTATIRRIVREREKHDFESLENFLRRVKPGEKERRSLARAGALNELPQVIHRRQAMWQAELPLHDDLFQGSAGAFPDMIPAMTLAERLTSDFAVQDASSGPHPMKLWRTSVASRKIQRASDLQNLPGGIPVVVGGMAICRQRPGTAKGHCFISLEDETGIANLFVPRDTFHHFRQIIVTEAFLLVAGRLQRSRGDQPTVYVTAVAPLAGTNPDHAVTSHDFH